MTTLSLIFRPATAQLPAASRCAIITLSYVRSLDLWRNRQGTFLVSDSSNVFFDYLEVRSIADNLLLLGFSVNLLDIGIWKHDLMQLLVLQLSNKSRSIQSLLEFWQTVPAGLFFLFWAIAHWKQQDRSECRVFVVVSFVFGSHQLDRQVLLSGRCRLPTSKWGWLDHYSAETKNMRKCKVIQIISETLSVYVSV